MRNKSTKIETKSAARLRARLKRISPESKQGIRGSPLDAMKEIAASTEDLRAPSGKLSATAVAKIFGISLSKLAGWLGRTRQAVNQTPDADSLQCQLQYFERVARLRVSLSNDKFLKWLRIPDAELDGKSPLDLMALGERQVVADLVEDMLTGAPM